MVKIYVSYNQRDRVIAERVVDGFRSRGHTVLWDIDLLDAGLDYRVVLAQALKDCPVFVSILTNNSVSASYPMSELGAARILGKVLIPLISMTSITQTSFKIYIAFGCLDPTWIKYWIEFILTSRGLRPRTRKFSSFMVRMKQKSLS